MTGTSPTPWDGTLPVALSGEAAGKTLPSGFPGMDGVLGGGFRRGDLVILAGDTGVGKSALALAIALRTAADGHSVAFLSGEMTAARLMERALAIEGRVRVDDLRRGTLDESSRSRTQDTATALSHHPIRFHRLDETGVAGIHGFLERHADTELAIVDPTQSLVSGRLGLDDELAGTARRLKALALEHSITMLAVTGLAASPAGRSNPRPLLADLGGMGAMGQHADVVIALYREELYQSDRHVEGAAEATILKNRNGPVGLVDLFFYKQWLRFEDMLEPDR